MRGKSVTCRQSPTSVKVYDLTRFTQTHFERQRLAGLH